MIRIIKDFITKSYFCFSPNIVRVKEDRDSFEAIWLNVASDFNKSFEEIREGYDKRN